MYGWVKILSLFKKKSSGEAIQPQKTSATLKSWKGAVIILRECFGK